MERQYLYLKHLLLIIILSASHFSFAQQLELQQTIHTNTQGTSFWGFTGTSSSFGSPSPSTPCSLTASIHNGVCFHNYTFADPTDDLFSLIYDYVQNPDAGASNQFNITILGQTYGPFTYGEGGQIDEMPSNGQPFDVVFSDVDNPNCTITQVALSQPCSSCPSFPHSYSSNSPVCEGESIVFTREEGLGITYEWEGPDGFTSIAVEPVISQATTANAGTYSVTMTNYYGCTEVATVDVEVIPALTNVDAGTYPSLCPNEAPIQLMGSPAGGTYSGPGVNSNLFDPSLAGSGTHEIQYTVLDDCTGNPVVGMTTIQVITTAGVAPSIPDISVCEGSSTMIAPGSAPEPITIWTEIFNENSVGVTGPNQTYTPPSNGQWEIYGNFSKLNRWWKYYKVTAHSLTGRATKKKLCFESQPIDISGKQNVAFSVDIWENGDLEPTDFVDVTYIIDGVSTKITNWEGQGNSNHTLTGKNGANDGDWGSTVVNMDGLSGNSLILQICVKNNAGGEYINIDNIVVTHTPVPPTYYFYDADPALGNANLLAGPVTSYDPMTTTQNSPQTIWVTQQNANGCETNATPVVVEVSPMPQIQLASNSPICEGSTLNITATTNNENLTWEWTGPNGFTSTDQNISIQNVTPIESGDYSVTVTSPMGCSSSASIAISIFDTPSSPVAADITVCGDGNTEIAPSGSTPDRVVFWTEQFDENGVGITGPGPVYTPPTNGQWSITGNYSKLTNPNRYFKVTNHSLSARNPKRKVCFVSETIDISGKQDVGFSIDISEYGDLEPSDYADVIYYIDGVATKITNWQGQGNYKHTLTGKNGANDGDWGATTVDVSGISGNSLIIKICVRTSASSEYINLDNVVVSYQPSPQYYFYDADPTNGNANILAGPVASYDPMTTPATSPQTIWVTNQNDNCESEATPVVVTVGAIPVTGITVSDTMPCTNQDLTLNETSGVATSWSWTGPNGFTSTEQNPTINSVTSANSGIYEVTASTNSACSSTASIYVQVNAQVANETPCFDLVIPPTGYTIDFAPNVYNFYDAEPTSGNANLIAAGVSSYTFTPSDVFWITTGTIGDCESAPMELIVNDPNDIYTGNGFPQTYSEAMADYTSFLTVIPNPFTRLALKVNQTDEIDIFHSFSDAYGNTNAIALPYPVDYDQYVFYRRGDPNCPTIGLAHLAIWQGKVSNSNPTATSNKQVELGVEKIIESDEVVLQQNRPNPFSQQTIIGFILPETTSATLSIFDASGRLVHQITKDFPKGQNQITIQKSELRETGILFYQLQTEKSVSTRRMLFMK